MGSLFISIQFRPRYPKNTFIIDDTYLTPFFQRVQSYKTINGQKIMCIFYTDGFIPVASYCGVVGSPSWFIKCLIGKTVNI